MLESYKKNQWKIFPCEATKGPKLGIGSWDRVARVGYDDGSERIGLPCQVNGLIVIDVDCKNGAPGNANWAKLVAEHGHPKTLSALTPSGGQHYVFKAPEGITPHGKLSTGIDIKWKGYILVEPSPGYMWEGELDEVAEMPEWLHDMVCEKRVEKPREVDGIHVPKTRAELEPMLARAKPLMEDRDVWLQVGMELHHDSLGSDEGLQLWKDYSWETANCEYTWDSFKGKPNSRTIASLYERDKPLKKLEAEKASDAEIDNCWTVEGAKEVADPEKAVQWFNRNGFSMFSENGKILRVVKDSKPVKFSFIDVHGFNNVHSAKVVRVHNKDGIVDLKSATDYWLKHTNRQTYIGMAFRPGGKLGHFNLWSDIPCQREEGDCIEILEFLENVICAGSKARFEFLLDWFAQLVQIPHVKSTIVPVIIGGQGCGKGLLTDGIMKNILGDLYLLLDDANEISERFNEAQSRKFLTVLDEATWGGSFQLANKLKRITGSESMRVEEKFGAKYTIDNFSRYMVTSNDIDTVKIEPGNRRFLVFETAQPRGAKYYSDMWNLVRKGVIIRRFYDFLMKRDIKEFNCWDFPTHLDTQGAGTKMASLAPVPRYICGLMFDTPKKLWHVKGGALVVCSMDLYQDFVLQENITSRSFWSVRRFVAELEKFLPLLHGISRQTWLDKHRKQAYYITPTDLRILCSTRLRLPDMESIADTEYFDGKFEYKPVDF